jgi:hypothetical protein
MEYTVKITGSWNNLQILLDCYKPTEYLLKKQGKSSSIFLEKIPPYRHLYENILHFQQGRFPDPDQ